MADWSNEEFTQVVGEVLRRSSVDPEFRALAVKDPTAAVAKVSPKPLPTGMNLQFHDNAGVTKHVVLPDPIAGIEELSEQELQAVAGGQINVSWGR